MKLTDLQELENEQIQLLRERSKAGDNQAAQVLLDYLRNVSQDISEWKARKDAKEKK